MAILELQIICIACNNFGLPVCDELSRSVLAFTRLPSSVTRYPSFLTYYAGLLHYAAYQLDTPVRQNDEGEACSCL